MLNFQEHFKEKIENVRKIEHKGNNQLFEVKCGGKNYLLKVYSRHMNNWERGQSEFSAMTYLWSRGFESIPQPIAFYKEANVGIYSFEPGRILKSSDIKENDIESAVNFLVKVHQLGNEDKKLFGPASSACLSLSDYVKVLDRRFTKISAGISSVKEVKKFLNSEVGPKIRELEKEFSKLQDLNRELPLESQVLTPGDFGFHNILVASNKYTFVDFEYFGRDDPARQILDFLHHDQSREIKKDMKELFIKKYCKRAKPFNGFEERLRLADKMVGMAWVLIYLNVLSKDYLKHMKLEKGSEGIIIKNRIEKAKEKLNNLSYFK